MNGSCSFVPSKPFWRESVPTISLFQKAVWRETTRGIVGMLLGKETNCSSLNEAAWSIWRLGGAGCYKEPGLPIPLATAWQNELNELLSQLSTWNRKRDSATGHGRRILLSTRTTYSFPFKKAFFLRVPCCIPRETGAIPLGLGHVIRCQLLNKTDLFLKLLVS